jgi:chorismate synthase
MMADRQLILAAGVGAPDASVRRLVELSFLSLTILPMSGNSFGKLFTVTTFGESHGPAIGCVIDGCPPGMALSEADIQPELDRRKPGTSRHVTQRQESDTVQILSGVYQGLTTGTPIALLIPNEDQRSKDYGNIAESFRPGHADYTYWHKYGVRDPRGGGRSSARLTAPVVGAAAIARKWLQQQYGTVFMGCMSQLGDIDVPFQGWEHVANNPFFAASGDAGLIARMEAAMDELRRAGDSIGARIDVVAHNVPVGLGQPIYDKLDADIAYAMMGINAVKGVEIGAGFKAVAQKGSEHGDELTPQGFVGNNAGGMLGGISTGQDITVSIAIKPTSSIRTPRRSIDKDGKPVMVETFGRHDPCVGIRATPIAEAMLALVLMDHALMHRAQCGDVRVATPDIARVQG